MESLADFLGTAHSNQTSAPDPSLQPLEQLSGKAFSKAVLNSPEFRRYIVNGLTLGDIPPAVLCRLMDHGWGKPPDRVEHTGADGRPIETVKIIRIIVDPQMDEAEGIPHALESIH